MANPARERKAVLTGKAPAPAGQRPLLGNLPAQPRRNGNEDQAAPPATAGPGFDFASIPVSDPGQTATGAAPGQQAAAAPGLEFDEAVLLPLLGAPTLNELRALIAASPMAAELVRRYGAPAVLALLATSELPSLNPRLAQSALSTHRDQFEPARLQQTQLAATQPGVRESLASSPVLDPYLKEATSKPISFLYVLNASEFADISVEINLSATERQDAAKRQQERNESRTRGGTFDPGTRAVYINSANAGRLAVVHEYIHSLGIYSRSGGLPFYEGITQYFARRVVGEAAAASDFNGAAYRDETVAVAELVPLIGEALIGRAYFLGEWGALITAVDNRLGAGSFASIMRILGDKQNPYKTVDLLRVIDPRRRGATAAAPASGSP